jgi:UPF0755 protein
MKSKIFLFAFIFLLFTIICCGSAALYAWHKKIPIEFWDSVLPMPEGQAISVIIRPNQTVSEIARNFHDEGIIEDSARDFARWLAKFKIDRRIIPGKYFLIPSTAWDVARQMRTAIPLREAATIVPGTSIYDFTNIFFSSDDQKSSMNSSDIAREIQNDSLYPKQMLELIPKSKEGRLAFLLPDTYFTAELSPKELIQTASGAWWNKFGKQISNDPKEAKEKAIIASLIEREALWDSERGKIAGVIYNRLRKSMLLQIDATVVYAHLIQGRRLTRVLYKDLEIDSPYNLYKYGGLTPEPICVPSLSSWEAAFNPEIHNLLYYVAGNDGHHLFSKTHSEHLQNIKKVRQK